MTEKKTKRHASMCKKINRSSKSKSSVTEWSVGPVTNTVHKHPTFLISLCWFVADLEKNNQTNKQKKKLMHQNAVYPLGFRLICIQQILKVIFFRTWKKWTLWHHSWEYANWWLNWSLIAHYVINDRHFVLCTLTPCQTSYTVIGIHQCNI